MNTFSQMLKELELFHKKYEKFNEYDLPEELYNEFNVTGNRRNFENKYFGKRSCLIARGLNAYFNGRKADEKLEEIIESICKERTWILPAHASSHTIDLFSALTAQALCEIAYYIELPPDLKNTIHNVARERIKEPFEKQVLLWESKKNNWAAVCAGSVGMVYLYEFPQEFKNIKDRLLKCLDVYLESMGNDGCCIEGVNYWQFGFEKYLCFAELLRDVEGTDILKGDKVKAIAEYQQHMFLKNNITASFADAMYPTIPFNIGMTHFLRKEFGSDIKVPPVQYRFVIGEGETGRDWDVAFRMYLWFDDKISDDANYFEKHSGEKYFSDAEWYINRKKKYAFAAKGGHNNEPHNHNDVGNFVITDGHNQLVTDIGAGEYTKDYFSSKRYDMFYCSSEGHSVPIIDGQKQKAGPEYTAEVIKAKDNHFVIEMRNAYDIKELTGLKRGFRMDEESVVMKDTFSFENGQHKITERFISAIKPEISENEIMVGSMYIQANCSAKVSEKEICTPSEEKKKVYVIDFDLKENEFVCKFVF